MIENTAIETIQTSPSHSVVFIDRYHPLTTYHEAYLLSIPRGLPPIIGTEPLDAIKLRIIYNSIKGKTYNEAYFKTMANRCFLPEDKKLE